MVREKENQDRKGPDRRARDRSHLARKRRDRKDRDRRDLGRRPGRAGPAARMVRPAPGPVARERRPTRALARVVRRANPAHLQADRKARVASPGLKIQAGRRVPNRVARVAAISPAAGAAAIARTILEVVLPMTDSRPRLDRPKMKRRNRRERQKHKIKGPTRWRRPVNRRVNST